MASCSRIDGWIQAYLDGELPASERVIFEQHIAECRGCSALHRTHQGSSAFLFEVFADYRLGRSLVRPILEHLPDFQQLVVRNTDVGSVNRRAKHAAEVRWRARIGRTVPIVIGLMLVVGALILSKNWPEPPRSTTALGLVTSVHGLSARIDGQTLSRDTVALKSYIEPSAAYDTGLDGLLMLTLEGPTHVKLNTGTRVTIVDERRIRLERGRIWLDVSKGEREFVVQTPTSDITVFGTTFDVEVDGSRTSVVVQEGEVMVERGKLFGSVTSGQRMDVEPGSTVLMAKDVDVEKAMAWTEAIVANAGAKTLFSTLFTPLNTIAITDTNQLVWTPTADLVVEKLRLVWEPDRYTEGHCGYMVYVYDWKIRPLFRERVPSKVFADKSRYSYELSLEKLREETGVLHLRILPIYSTGGHRTKFEVEVEVREPNGLRARSQ